MHQRSRGRGTREPSVKRSTAPSGWLKMARSDSVLMSAMNGGWVCLEKFRARGSGFRTLGLRFRSGGWLIPKGSQDSDRGFNPGMHPWSELHPGSGFGMLKGRQIVVRNFVGPMSG